MSRIHCLMMALALASAGTLSVAPHTAATAQTARSYCLISPGGEPGGCGFPSLEACRLDSAGYGSCIASEQPAWAAAAGASTAQTKRKR